MVLFKSKSGILRSVRKLSNSITILIITIIITAVFLNIFGMAKGASNYIIHPSLIVATFICMWVNGVNLKDIGVSLNKINLANLMIGLIMGACSIGIVFWSMVMSGKLQFNLVRFVQIFSPSTLQLFAFYALVAIGEEFFFRGYLIGILRKGMKTWFAIIASALLFTALHLVNPEFNLMAFIDTFLIGLLLGYLFVKSKSLLPCIAFHFIWNSLQDMLAFPSQGGEVITGMVILLNIIVVFLYSTYHKRSNAVTELQQVAI